jgi:hypothetical protein
MALLGIVSHGSTKMGGGLIKYEDAAPRRKRHHDHLRYPHSSFTTTVFHDLVDTKEHPLAVAAFLIP